MQGGGLYINGDATLNNCQIFSNEAPGVYGVYARFLEPGALQRPDGTLRAFLLFCMQSSTVLTFLNRS